MHFLKCLAIGIAVASGLTGLLCGLCWLADYLRERYGSETCESIMCLAGLFLAVAFIATAICYFATATHT